MLSIDEIRKSVDTIVSKYPLKKVSVFGSYAADEQNDKSDIDFLVEFTTPSISLFTISELKCDLQDLFNLPVDVIHSPISPDSMIVPQKVVDIFVKP